MIVSGLQHGFMMSQRLGQCKGLLHVALDEYLHCGAFVLQRMSFYRSRKFFSGAHELP